MGDEIRGLRVIGHGGATEGCTAHAGWHPPADLSVEVLMNSQGPISPAALASELAGAVLPWQRPGTQAFTGDVSPLAGRYAGPARGQEMQVEVAAADGGIAIVAGGQAAQPLAWVAGWTFRTGNTFLTFTREGDSGPTALLRFDQGGGYYMLKPR